MVHWNNHSGVQKITSRLEFFLRRPFSFFFIILGPLFFYLPLSGQNTRYLFSHINAEDGLYTSEVMNVYQDRFGFMWFATLDGLYRYNGYNFRYFCHEVSDPESLPSSSIFYLFEDGAGELWVGGLSTLARFDRIKEKFHRVELPFEANFNWAPIPDKFGYIWITQNDRSEKQKIYRLHGATGKTVFPDIPSMGENVEKAIRDKEGNIWCFDETGAFKIEFGDTETFRIGKVFSRHEGLAGEKINHLHVDGLGRLWGSTLSGKVFYYQGQGDSSFSFFEPVASFIDWKSTDIPIQSITEDAKGNIWLATRWAILIIDNTSFEFEVVEHVKCDDQSLPGTGINGVFHGQFGVHWVYLNLGITKIQEQKTWFSHFIVDALDPLFNSNNSIFALCRDSRNAFWVSAPRYGLMKFEEFDPLSVGSKEVPANGARFEKHSVSYIMESSSGNLWFSTFSDGLLEFNPENEKFSVYRQDTGQPGSLSQDRAIRELVEDEKGRVWIARMNGISVYNPSTEAFNNYNFPGRAYPKDQYHTFAIHIDRSGRLWAGASGDKFYAFDREDEKFTEYDASFSHGILFIHEDTVLRQLLLGTHGHGVAVFDLATNQFQDFLSRKDGLSGGVVYSILQDDNRNLWLATNKGISKINMDSKSILNYGRKDGLPFEDFNSGAYARDNEGRLFFGGAYGVVFFHPGVVKSLEPSFQPKLLLASCSVFGKEVVLDKPIYEMEEIVLSSADNYVEFELSVMDFTFPSDIKYKYRLEGWDNRWTEWSDNNTAVYANLSPGKYTFRAMGTNGYGEPVSRQLAVRLKIVPAFFERKLVRYALGAFLALLAVFFLARYFRSRQREKIRNLQIEEERLRNEVKEAWLKAWRTQMNPHFMYNTLNAISGSIVEEDSRSASRNLSDFAELMRIILDHSDSTMVTLSEEIKFLNLYVKLQKLRKRAAFEFAITVDPALDEKKHLIPSMIVQPFVENSIMHAFEGRDTQGKLQVEFKKMKDKLVCTVRDNGVGWKKSFKPEHLNLAGRKSRGIRNVLGRLRILNDLYQIESEVKIQDIAESHPDETGTMVVISLNLRSVPV